MDCFILRIMYKENKIESDHGLKVKVSKHGSPRIANLLKNTVFGTEGKLRYRQQEIASRLKSQPHIQFIEILKGTRVLGTVGISNRTVFHGDTSMRTLYVRYLSIAHAFKSKKKQSFKPSVSSRTKKGQLRELITNKITSHFEQPFIEFKQNGLFYAYVESANINSKKLCISMGFEPTRKIETLLFSRFNPTQKKTISNISEFEIDEVKEHLQSFYHNYSFYFEDQVFRKGFYFVKKERGQIIGGIRATPVNWELVDYPGLEGWLMRDILPYIPFTNRLFPPDVLKFLAFDYAWHKPGYYHLIPELMSHCCSLFGINLGMIWGDSESELIKQLKIGNHLGFIHSIVGSVYADLMVRYIDHQKINSIDIESKNEESDFVDENSMNNDSFDIIDSNNQISEESVYIEPENDNNTPNFDLDEIIRSKVIQLEKETLEEEKNKYMQEILKQPVFVSALDMT